MIQSIANGSVYNAIDMLFITVVSYILCLIPFSAVLFLEKFVFYTKILSELGLKVKFAKKAIISKLWIIAVLLGASCVIPIVRLLFDKNANIGFSYLLFQIPNNMIVVSCEEALFRGYMQIVMIRRFGVTSGILITASLFSLVHLSGRIFLQNVNIFQLIVSVILMFAGSAAFGYFANKDKCIYGSALVHYAFNICRSITLL